MIYAKNKTPGNIIFHIVLYLIMALLCVAFIYPMWHQFVLSFSAPEYARTIGLKIWPPEWSLESYKMLLFEHDLIYVGYRNTLFRTVLGTAVMVATTFLGGYVLTKKKMPLRGFLLAYIMIPMFFSGGLIPSYINVRNLGLMNNLWLFVMTGATSTWYLLLTRNFINTIPESLEESAMIDGAKPLTIVFKIIMPLCAPIIAVLALWSAVAQWNAWFDAFMYCAERNKIVLQLIVRRLVIDSDDTLLGTAREGGVLTQATASFTPETVKSAVIFISVAPILAVYPFLQKYFVKGILVGSIKG